MPEKISTLKVESSSVDSLEATEPLSKSKLEQLNNKKKDRKLKSQYHRKVEEQDHVNAELELEQKLSELNFLELIEKDFPINEEALTIGENFIKRNQLMGIEVSFDEIKTHISERLGENEELSSADQVKNYKEQLSTEGKSQVEILKNLIFKFENEKVVSTWVENWKNFLKLHQFAETKPPAERKAIQRIISKADFTNENSFDTAFTEIQNSTEISTETKTDLQKQFGAANIQTVSSMDNALNQIKNHKKKIEKQIDGKKSERESLQSEITDLEKELDDLAPDDPKREELKTELTQKKQTLQQTKTEISDLEKAKPNDISFTIRSGFTVKLNPNGSRTINVEGSNFAIQLPNNALFMGHKNMLSINLAFTYKALNGVGMDSLFTPKLNSGEVPDKKQRLFSNQILQQLGYKTDQIISQTSINQLEKDLSKLKQQESNSTGIEDLATLGIWDISTQEVNINRMKSCLNFIRQNRGRQIGFEDIRAIN